MKCSCNHNILGLAVRASAGRELYQPAALSADFFRKPGISRKRRPAGAGTGSGSNNFVVVADLGDRRQHEGNRAVFLCTQADRARHLFVI